jgi:hypothetical protein
LFDKLKKKWKVNGLQLALIICTFAIGGSLTGFISKEIMNLLSISEDWLWTILYIGLVTFLWPLTVIVTSIFFGQFHFFFSYIKRLGERLGILKGKTEKTLER